MIETTKESKLYQLGLTLVLNRSTIWFKKLLSHFRSAQKGFEAAKKRSSFFPHKIAQLILLSQIAPLERQRR